MSETLELVFWGVRGSIPVSNNNISHYGGCTSCMEFIAELASVQQVDLLPYHRYGEGKYTRLGLDYPLKDLPEYEEEPLAEIEDLIRSFGIKTTIGG